VGIETPGPFDVTNFRLAQLTDPAGNTVILSEPKS
jgi:hypothetical protein